MRRRLPIIAAALLYVAVLLVILLWPTHVDEGVDTTGYPPMSWLIDVFGLTPGESYRLIEFSANILLFLPLGALALALVPRLKWWRVTLGAALFSTVLEVTQTVARPDRTGSVSDVVANTTGAAIGALLAGLWLWWSDRRASRRSRAGAQSRPYG